MMKRSELLLALTTNIIRIADLAQCLVKTRTDIRCPLHVRGLRHTHTKIWMEKR